MPIACPRIFRYDMRIFSPPTSAAASTGLLVIAPVWFRSHPALAIDTGSLLGLVFNFVVSEGLVLSRVQRPDAQPVMDTPVFERLWGGSMPEALSALAPRTTSSRFALPVLAAFPLLVAVFYILASSGDPLLNPDSPGYLFFDSDRPIGYPAFLFLVKQLTGGYLLVRPLQIVLFCAAVFGVSISVSRATGSWFLPLIFQVGALGYPGPIHLANQIMSDSLSASAILLFIVALFGYARAPSVKRYLLVCLVFGGAITLRLDNVALLAPALILPLLMRPGTSIAALSCVALGIATAAVSWQATHIAKLALHGDAEPSMLVATSLLQKVIFTPPRAAIPSTTCDAAFIEEITAPMIAYMQGVPAEFADIMRFRYSSYVRYESILPGLVALHGLRSVHQVEGTVMCYTLARFRQDPGSVIAQTAHEYKNLISNYTFISPGRWAAYRTYLESHPPPLPPRAPKPAEQFEMASAAIAAVGGPMMSRPEEFTTTSATPFEPPQPRSPALILVLRTFQIAATVLSVALVARLLTVWVWPIRDRRWIVLGLISLFIQLHLIIVAIAEIAQPRYLFPIWPALWLVTILTLWSLVEMRVRRRAPH